MIIVTNTSQIKKGEAGKLIERFNKTGKVELMEGFLGLEVMLTENTKEYDEVTVSTRWNTKEDSTGGRKATPSANPTPDETACRTIFEQ
ncbi:hypothetical protein HMSSN036_38000 [Paenibacillus macerans]|nr:hypothetical protein HMSSN036_38000 [Paenibacillus macerans]